MNLHTPIDQCLDIELKRCGLTQASRHFDAALDCARDHDDAGFAREMSSFRSIAGSWNQQGRDGANNTVPSAPGNGE